MAKRLTFKKKSDGQPVNVFAVVTDKANKQSQVLETNSVWIIDLRISYDKSVAHFIFCPGAFDSSGEFHRDPAFQPANMTVDGKNEGKPIWDARLKGKRIIDIDEVIDMMKEAMAVERAAINVWRIPEVETEIVNE